MWRSGSSTSMARGSTAGWAPCSTTWPASPATRATAGDARRSAPSRSAPCCSDRVYPAMAAMAAREAVPGFGGQLQMRSLPEYEPEISAAISYVENRGTFADGSRFQLRVPTYTLTGVYRPLPAGVLFSPRAAPVVFGLGIARGGTRAADPLPCRSQGSQPRRDLGPPELRVGCGQGQAGAGAIRLEGEHPEPDPAGGGGIQRRHGRDVTPLPGRVVRRPASRLCAARTRDRRPDGRRRRALHPDAGGARPPRPRRPRHRARRAASSTRSAAPAATRRRSGPARCAGCRRCRTR